MTEILERKTGWVTKVIYNKVCLDRGNFSKVFSELLLKYGLREVTFQHNWQADLPENCQELDIFPKKNCPKFSFFFKKIAFFWKN